MMADLIKLAREAKADLQRLPDINHFTYGRSLR